MVTNLKLWQSLGNFLLYGNALQFCCWLTIFCWWSNGDGDGDGDGDGFSDLQIPTLHCNEQYHGVLHFLKNIEISFTQGKSANSKSSIWLPATYIISFYDNPEECQDRVGLIYLIVMLLELINILYLITCKA